MKIAICGMSGFVGNALHQHFTKNGVEVIPISIRADSNPQTISDLLGDVDALINLAGANILGRWTKNYKRVLRASRLETTNLLVEAIRMSDAPPKVMLNASAVGIYDPYHQHDEYSHYYANDFLATLVQDWEDAATHAQAHGIRVCLMRFGVVYGKGGGAMAKMLPPFKLGLGGKMGDGFQMISWIHLDDLVRACAFLLEHEELEGVFNFTTPEPICNLRQTAKIGQHLHRPTFMSMPGWVVKLLFGEGSCVMLDSKEVYPKRLQEAGFEFLYPTFDSAMEQIVRELT